MRKTYISVTILIFTALTFVFALLMKVAPDYNFMALEVGNLIMCALSFITYFMVIHSMDRVQSFVRGVSGSSFLRLMVCMISILIYIMLNRTHIHKPTVFVLFGIYAVYTTAETLMLTKIAKQK